MKRMKIDYKIINALGDVASLGHINYSLSHFFSVLFKQNLIKVSLNHFWTDFECQIKKNGILYYAFYTGDFSLLNRTERVFLSRLLRCFGYFIFEKEINLSPCFLFLNNKWALTDGKNIMSFHLKRSPAKIISNYKKHFAISYGKSNQKQAIFSGAYVDLVIDDLENDCFCATQELTTSYCSKIDKLNKTKFHKHFQIKTKNIVTCLDISNYELDTFDSKDCDFYFDGVFYYYVRFPYSVSVYNHYIDSKNVVMNMASMSCIQLDDSQYTALKNNNLSLFSMEEIEKLKELSFIGPFTNETNFYRNLKKSFDKPNTLGLSVLTTTNCNARCFYCYEKGVKHVNMDDKTLEALYNFIMSYSPQKVTFGWFGGEPLVNTCVIDKLCEYCNNQQIQYESTMISNGALVDKYLDKFKGLWKVKRIQITLDGVGEKYNKVKNYMDNSFNYFEKVVENIHKLLEQNTFVSIRLNFNQENYEDVLECIEFIHKEFGNKKNLKVYACHIFGGVDTIHLADGRNLYLIIYRKLMAFGYIRSLKDLRFNFINAGYCFTTNKSHFVINSDGNIFTCDHSIKDFESGGIGNLKNGIKFDSKYKFWTNNVYPLEKCKKCKFLFACQGGCKYEFNYNKNKPSPCLWQFEILDELILSALEFKII